MCIGLKIMGYMCKLELFLLSKPRSDNIFLLKMYQLVKLPHH